VWTEDANGDEIVVTRRRTIGLGSLVALVSALGTSLVWALNSGACSAAPWNTATKTELAEVAARQVDFADKTEAAAVKDRVLVIETKMDRLQSDVTKTGEGVDDIRANLYQLMTNVGVEPKRKRGR